MNIPEIKKYVEQNGYATEFKSGKFIMSESLYKQIYKKLWEKLLANIILIKFSDNMRLLISQKTFTLILNTSKFLAKIVLYHTKVVLWAMKQR